MRNKREILRAHYAGLAKKTGAWMGIFAMVSTLFVAIPTDAAQITTRSTTLGNSAAGATTTYTFAFQGPTATTIRAIKFELCSSPLQTTACTAVASSSMSSSAFVAGNSTGGLSAWTLGSQGATSAILSDATGIAGNTSLVVQLSGVVNPSTANTSFYTRVTTYTDTGATAPTANGQDYGAMALSTGTEVSVNANVQESLVFSVGTTGTCGSITGSTVNIGNNPGTDNVLSSTAATAGTSVMCVNTNAATGYVISYISNQTSSNGFTNGTYTIADNAASDTFANATAGNNDFFGINAVANAGENSGPTAGANYSGGVAPTLGAAYDTAGSFGFARGTLTTLASQTTGPTANTLFTVTYAAQAGSSTAVGAYQVKMNYVATGTF